MNLYGSAIFCGLGVFVFFSQGAGEVGSGAGGCGCRKTYRNYRGPGKTRGKEKQRGPGLGGGMSSPRLRRTTDTLLTPMPSGVKHLTLFNSAFSGYRPTSVLIGAVSGHGGFNRFCSPTDRVNFDFALYITIGGRVVPCIGDCVCLCGVEDSLTLIPSAIT